MCVYALKRIIIMSGEAFGGPVYIQYSSCELHRLVTEKLNGQKRQKSKRQQQQHTQKKLRIGTKTRVVTIQILFIKL